MHPLGLNRDPTGRANEPGSSSRGHAHGRRGAKDLDGPVTAVITQAAMVCAKATLPAIRPVNHALIDGQPVIRTHEGAVLTAATGAGGVVVAYEADMIDADTHLGWSVVVTGFARLVTDPRKLARYERLLTPWTSERMEHTVAIQLDQINGFQLVTTASEAQQSSP